MKSRSIYLSLVFLFVGFSNCINDKQETRVSAGSQTAKKVDSMRIDSLLLEETFNQQDIIENEFEADRLKPIRINFKRINSITNWTAKETKELLETTEGGEVTFYYLNNRLEKTVSKSFGETFQQLTEYYLLKGELSFVFEKSFKYNRPIYYDETSRKENNDTASFDFDRSEIVETRSYFFKGKLIHQVNNQDCGSPFAEEYLAEEQKRIRADFDKLYRLR